MLAYILRRTLYAIPILIGVNLLTFWLFFVVNSPEDMARMQLGQKRVTPEAIEKWKKGHGYDKPLLFNGDAKGVDAVPFQPALPGLYVIAQRPVGKSPLHPHGAHPPQHRCFLCPEG